MTFLSHLLLFCLAIGFAGLVVHFAPEEIP